MNPVTDPELLRILNGEGGQSAPQGGGPVYGPPPTPKQPEPPRPPAQKDIWSPVSREEAEGMGLDPAYTYQRNSLGEIKTISKTDAPKAGTDGTDPKAAQRAANLESLTNQINEVQRLFNEGQRDNAIPILGSLWEYLPTPANTEFDSAAAGLAEQGLAAFRVPGVGAQSDTELRQFTDANKPSRFSNDSTNLQRLRQLRNRVDATREAMGLPPANWLTVDDEAAPAERDVPAAAANNIAPGDYGSANPTPPALTPAPTQYEAATDTRSTPNPELSARIDKMLRARAPLNAINSMLRSQGYTPIDEQGYNDWQAFLAENPEYDGPTAEAIKTEQMSQSEQLINALGQSDAGAYAVGAGQFLSGNTLDNLTDDPAATRMAMAQLAEDRPGATMAGQLSGGVMGALTGEAGLARLGMASGLGRGVLADTAMGAAQGAGAADDGNRLTGAAQGAVGAAIGSTGGTLAMRGAGRALSPTGGRLADLYAEGVRPTPGQRFADSGIAGRALNATEEALTSVPIVGTAISGARQEARDQFQIGAFNQALREIGEELPRGMKPGTDPNKYAQEAFAKIYDEARSGMRVVADEQLANDLNELAPDIQTLGPQAQNKLRAIMANTVKDDLSGDAYKRTMSDLGKHIARLGKSAMGEEQQLADILTSIRGSLDNAARRHSDPEAVALLDRADAGYSKLVRIEEAAARRGGDDGTFTPAGFDSAVQKTSGGVRSKAYLRGEAQMQDYANQGKSLSDRMANSGTTDRALAATTVAGGAAYLEPTTLGLLGGIGALYAPGARRAVTGALAPSSGKRKAIAARLKRIERITGAVSGAAGAQASIPSQ